MKMCCVAVVYKNSLQVCFGKPSNHVEYFDLFRSQSVFPLRSFRGTGLLGANFCFSFLIIGKTSPMQVPNAVCLYLHLEGLEKTTGYSDLSCHLKTFNCLTEAHTHQRLWTTLNLHLTLAACNSYLRAVLPTGQLSRLIWQLSGNY